MAKDIWQTKYAQIHIIPSMCDNPGRLPRLSAFGGPQLDGKVCLADSTANVIARVTLAESAGSLKSYH